MSAIRIPTLIVPGLVATTFLTAWIAGTWFAIPAFVWSTSDVTPPANLVKADLLVSGMKCRKSSQKLHRLLFGRVDDNRIDGYLRTVLFPAPGAGHLEVSYDPTQTDLARITQAIQLDREGLETTFRVQVELKADLSSPKALLHTLALALDHKDQDLFERCHAGSAGTRVDFAKLSAAWKDLFLEDLIPAGPVDKDGRVEVQGLSVGDRIPLEDLAPGIGPFVLKNQGPTWRILKADWSKITESGF